MITVTVNGTPHQVDVTDDMPLVVGSPGGIDLGGMAPPHIATEAEMPSMSSMKAETEL